jgi:hypothetical protein
VTWFEFDTKARAEERGEITVVLGTSGGIEWWGLSVGKAAHAFFFRFGAQMTHASTEQQRAVREEVRRLETLFGRRARTPLEGR